MPPKNKNVIHLSPESLPARSRELVPTELNLSRAESYTALALVVNVFNDNPDKAFTTPATAEDPEYNVLERTLNDGTHVRVRWGANKERTLADIHINGLGRSMFDIELNHTTGALSVRYGTTIAKERASGDAKKDAGFPASYITKAKSLIETRDITKRPADVVAIGSLKSRRQPKK